jgi:hypothetical protein
MKVDALESPHLYFSGDKPRLIVDNPKSQKETSA